MEKTNWGIIGTGTIANNFAQGLKVIPQAELVGVGSRSPKRAAAFAEKYAVLNVYSDYKELASDPEIDVIYIGTPHVFHKEHTLMCLNEGKPVLCEKPFALNLDEAEMMVSLARKKKLFLMEAMWTRFIPVMIKVLEWITQGEIGDIILLEANMGFKADYNPEGRIYNPELGGGALLDVGIYLVSLASLLFKQQPVEIQTLAHIGQTGIDEQTGFIFSYPQGELATLTCSIKAEIRQEACITGTNGYIHIPDFYCPSTAKLIRKDQVIKEIDIIPEGTGLNYEAREVMKCLYEGKTESDIMPLDESLDIMETMDKIRKLIGLRYPQEG